MSKSFLYFIFMYFIGSRLANLQSLFFKIAVEKEVTYSRFDRLRHQAPDFPPSPPEPPIHSLVFMWPSHEYVSTEIPDCMFWGGTFPLENANKIIHFSNILDIST